MEGLRSAVRLTDVGETILAYPCRGFLRKQQTTGDARVSVECQHELKKLLSWHVESCNASNGRLGVQLW